MSGSRAALRDWQGFLLAKSHVLRLYPGLLFQEAINEPDVSPQAAAAERALSAGRESRPFIRWLNKPQSAPRCLMTLAGHRDRVLACALSPDGSALVSGSWDGTFRFWDTGTGREWAAPAGTLLTASPDGATALSQSPDHAISLWDIAGHKVLRECRGSWGPVAAVSFSPDGGRILFGTDGGAVLVWDLLAGREPRALSAEERSVSVCSFSPDGSRLLSRTSEGPFKLWDSGSGRLVAAWPSDLVQDVWAFAPDGSYLVVPAADGALMLCEAQAGRPLRTLPLDKGTWVESCAVSPDGSRVAAGDVYCHPRIWSASTGQEIATLAPDRQTRLYEESSFAVKTCAFSPDGTRLITLSSNGYLVLWDPASGSEGRTLIPPLEGIGLASFFAFGPDGTTLLAPDYRHPGTLGLWEVATGRRLGRLGGHVGEVHCCAFAADRSRVATGSDDGTIKVWNAADLARLSVAAGHSDAVSVCFFSPDGSRILSGSKDGTLRVWDAGSGRELLTMDLRPSVRAGMSDRIEYARDESFRVRVSSSPQDLAQLLAAVKRCWFSADGGRIISASENGDRRTWDAETGLEIGAAGEVAGEAEAPPPDPGVREGGPWGRRLTLERPARTRRFKKSDKPTAAEHEIWIAEAGREIARFTDVMGEVTAGAVSPVDNGFVIGDDHGSVLILKLENAPRGGPDDREPCGSSH